MDVKYDLWVTPYLRWFIALHGDRWGVDDLGLGMIDSLDRFGFRRLDGFYLSWLRLNHKATQEEARVFGQALKTICPELAEMRTMEIRGHYEGPRSYAQFSVEQQQYEPETVTPYEYEIGPLEPEPVVSTQGESNDAGPSW